MNMYNLYFLEIYDHHQSGFVTYMNELIVGLQQQCDAKLNVVILKAIKIVLSDGTYKNAPDSELRANNSNQTMMNRVQEIFAQKKTVFQGLEFSTNYSTTYNPDVRKPLCIRLDGFDENKMAFYADPKSNMRYIYDSSKKIAFAYNEDEEYGDYVLDYYGIRDWVESLPKRSTSMMILQNYTIIGL